MRLTINTTVAILAAIVALSVTGCNSGGTAHANSTITINGEHGKVYSGTANQVSNQMGQDYAAGLRNMATRSAAPQQPAQ